jgi:hypothetical protein
MNCCPSADFIFLQNGLDIHERNIQADGVIRQFLPYKKITNLRYSYTRGDGGILTLCEKYIYTFPCNDSGLKIYTQVLDRLPA